MAVELVVAMSIILLAVLPLAFSVAYENKLLRACYNRAVVMEIVDGELEVLVAGEWRTFQEGTQPYSVRADAITNLPPGRFELTLNGDRLRLAWLPAEKDRGGRVVREAIVK